MRKFADAAAYLGVGGAIGRVEVALPLPREEGLLLVVAFLARGHQVGADRAAAAHERHHVIEGQRLRAHVALTVVAAAGRAPTAPPRSLAQGPRARLLATHGVVVHLPHVAVLVHDPSADTAAR